jgi:hypothetical protein
VCFFFTLLPVIKLIKDHWHGSRHISVIINETYKFNLQSSLIKFIILIDQYKYSFDNNGLVKPSCGTVALYGHFGFFLRYGGLSMNNLG